jgi:hypothetical protein
MPQPLPSPLPDRAAHFAPTFVDVPRAELLRTADNPVGRTVAELEMMLAPLLAGQEAEEVGRRWPVGQTIAFVIASCGLFWAGAAFAIWSWL